MIDIIRKVLANVCKAIYQPFLFAIVVSLLVLFFVMYLDKYKNNPIKNRIIMALKDWKERFCNSIKFRRIFYFVFCSVMVLFKTLINRDMWVNPVSDVIGVWGFNDKEGAFTTEIIENVVLFIPLIFFLFFLLETTSKRTSKFFAVMGKAIAISFLLSLVIEMLQLFLRLGTWQLSDLCFNTLGGIIGGLLYWISAVLRRSKSGE